VEASINFSETHKIDFSCKCQLNFQLVNNSILDTSVEAVYMVTPFPYLRLVSWAIATEQFYESPRTILHRFMGLRPAMIEITICSLRLTGFSSS